MVLRGKDPSSIDVGDVIVYATQQPYPIIHRVVAVRQQDGAYFFTTKGDNNAQVIRRADYEENIKETQLIGTAAVRIPYLGYVKIFAVEYIAQPIANIFK